MDAPSRLVKVDPGRRLSRRSSGPMILTPTGTYAERPINRARSVGESGDTTSIDPTNSTRNNDNVGNVPRKPTRDERQSTTWRDVVIPALLKIYKKLYADTEGLATLKGAKKLNVRCEGCIQGSQLKIVCLYFDEGLREYKALCVIALPDSSNRLPRAKHMYLRRSLIT